MNVIDNVTLLAIILTGAALIREREHGTIEHLLVMPVTPLEIMTSKVWAMGLVVLVACYLAMLFMVQGILRVPIEGSMALSCSARRYTSSPPRRSASSSARWRVPCPSSAC